MSHPVTVLRMNESVERIVSILKDETHNGFPVVQDYDPATPEVSHGVAKAFLFNVTDMCDLKTAVKFVGF